MRLCSTSRYPVEPQNKVHSKVTVKQLAQLSLNSLFLFQLLQQLLKLHTLPRTGITGYTWHNKVPNALQATPQQSKPTNSNHCHANGIVLQSSPGRRRGRVSSSRGRRSRERWQDIIGHLSAPTAALQRPTTTTGTVNHRRLRLLHVDVVSQFCPGQLFHGQTQRAVWRRSCRQRTFGVVVAVVVAVVVVVVVAAVASAIAIGNWQLAKRWPRLCNCLSQHCVSKWKSRLLLKELQVSRSLLPTSVALSLSLSYPFATYLSFTPRLFFWPKCCAWRHS